MTKKESFSKLEFVVNVLKLFYLSQTYRQNKLECLPLVKFLQSNTIFVSKATKPKLHTEEGFLSCQKYYAKLERLVRDKQTTLLVSSVSDKERKVLWYWNL